MLSLYWKLRSLTTRQEGQGMVEYALILVLVSIVVIVILLTMGQPDQERVLERRSRSRLTRTQRSSTFYWRAPKGALRISGRIALKKRGDDWGPSGYNHDALFLNTQISEVT